MGLLFTPSAMVVAQTILIVPILAALTRQTIEDLWVEYRDELSAMNVGPLSRIMTLLWDARFSLLTALSWGDASLVAPASASLTFVVSAGMAKVFLKEAVDHRRWISALLVCVGVALLK